MKNIQGLLKHYFCRMWKQYGGQAKSVLSLTAVTHEP